MSGGLDSEGNRCIATIARPVRDGSDFNGKVRWVLEDLPRCPVAPAAQSPASVAADYWQRVTLPSPRPAIAPGWAITGKYAYLETNGELRKTFGTDTAFGPLAIEAQGAYFVDWGDGTTTGPHRVEGDPWPDGQITHTYIDVGTYDVVVTERWSAIWVFGPNSGSLAALGTVGRIDDLRVEQLQAVVRPG